MPKAPNDWEDLDQEDIEQEEPLEENTKYIEEYEQVQSEKRRRLARGRLKQRALFAGIFVLSIVLLVAFFNTLGKGWNTPISKAPAPVSSLGLPNSTVEPPSEAQPAPSISDIPASTLPPTAADPMAWNLWLISAKHPVESNFSTPALSQIAQDGVVYLFDSRIVEALTTMRKDCNAATGGGLKISSGYTSYAFQKKTFDYYVDQFIQVGFSEAAARERAMQHAQPPGTTENHTGLAVEFQLKDAEMKDPAFANSEQYKWLVANGAEYGFVLRYTAEKQEITGVPSWPWHFRYVGVDEAKAMNSANVCLEEYVGKV